MRSFIKKKHEALDPWFETLKRLNGEYERVELSLQNAADSITTRSALLVSASGVLFGIFVQGLRNEVGLGAMGSALIAGLCGLVSLLPKRRWALDPGETRSELRALYLSQKLPTEVELLEGLLDMRDEHINEASASIDRRSGWFKFGVLMIVLSMFFEVFSVLVYLSRGGAVNGIW